MTLKLKTAGMLAEWVIQHRKGDAFKDDTLESLCFGLCEDATNGNMLYVLDNDIHVIGIITFIADRSNKILFVKNVLVTRHAALVIFAQHFLKNFKEFVITANRNNEEVTYNTSRLINHLLNMRGEQ